jgi:myo-inositol 2-dehydrogenase / D-chiro-inositol 1-dehydrogenase
MLGKMTRRRWFQMTGGVAAIGGLGTGIRFVRKPTVRIGIIGAGVRGSRLANSINELHWLAVKVKIVAICDVHRERADKLLAAESPSAEVTQDFNEILSRDDVDAVFIATPDHWHAPISLEALRAGKHVYCEKPMTLTISEGHKVAEAVRASGRTYHVGTQQRSDVRFQTACMLVRNGRLGQLRRVTITVPENKKGGPFLTQPVPKPLDWQRWLGPAPQVDYCPERFNVFRSWYEYSGGSMTDWGAHQVDIAHWAMGVENSGPVEVSAEGSVPTIKNGFNTPAQFAVDLKYPNGVTVHVRTSKDSECVLFEGDEGRIRVNRGRLTGKPVEDLRSNPLPADAIRLGHRRTYFGTQVLVHLQHFFDCVLNGDPPISDVNSQHRTITACHLANIALRLNRTVKWNPNTESFPGDPEATVMTDRASRAI